MLSVTYTKQIIWSLHVAKSLRDWIIKSSYTTSYQITAKPSEKDEILPQNS